MMKILSFSFLVWMSSLSAVVLTTSASAASSSSNILDIGIDVTASTTSITESVVNNNNNNNNIDQEETSHMDDVERDRLQVYYDRGYEWPIREFKPNTEGWNNLWKNRMEQIGEIDDVEERYRAYVNTILPSLIRNFTEYGWALTRISDVLHADLLEGLHDGITADKIKDEGKYSNNIEGDQPWTIQRDDLMDRVRNEIHLQLEEWIGIDLKFNNMLGFRLYRNNSNFKMHFDKKGTHSVGYVLHVDSSEDAEPWPFFIEDFMGRTHEIYLAPGDAIMFECKFQYTKVIQETLSTVRYFIYVYSPFDISLCCIANKLLHGRPRPLKGAWYSNVLSHFYPAYDGWQPKIHQDEAHYSVPPVWSQPAPSQKKHRPIEFRGGIKEPECANGWCRCDSETTTKWNGPVTEYGSYMDPIGNKHLFEKACDSDYEYHGDSADL